MIGFFFPTRNTRESSQVWRGLRRTLSLLESDGLKTGSCLALTCWKVLSGKAQKRNLAAGLAVALSTLRPCREPHSDLSSCSTALQKTVLIMESARTT